MEGFIALSFDFNRDLSGYKNYLLNYEFNALENVNFTYISLYNGFDISDSSKIITWTGINSNIINNFKLEDLDEKLTVLIKLSNFTRLEIDYFILNSIIEEYNVFFEIPQSNYFKVNMDDSSPNPDDHMAYERNRNSSQ